MERNRLRGYIGITTLWAEAAAGGMFLSWEHTVCSSAEVGVAEWKNGLVKGS